MVYGTLMDPDPVSICSDVPTVRRYIYVSVRLPYKFSETQDCYSDSKHEMADSDNCRCNPAPSDSSFDHENDDFREK